MNDCGMKKVNFVVLREIVMDVILLEVGFCDSIDVLIFEKKVY